MLHIEGAANVQGHQYSFNKQDFYDVQLQMKQVLSFLQ